MTYSDLIAAARAAASYRRGGLWAAYLLNLTVVEEAARFLNNRLAARRAAARATARVNKEVVGAVVASIISSARAASAPERAEKLRLRAEARAEARAAGRYAAQSEALAAQVAKALGASFTAEANRASAEELGDRLIDQSLEASASRLWSAFTREHSRVVKAEAKASAKAERDNRSASRSRKAPSGIRAGFSGNRMVALDRKVRSIVREAVMATRLAGRVGRLVSPAEGRWAESLAASARRVAANAEALGRAVGASYDVVLEELRAYGDTVAELMFCIKSRIDQALGESAELRAEYEAWKEYQQYSRAEFYREWRQPLRAAFIAAGLAA